MNSGRARGSAFLSWKQPLRRWAKTVLLTSATLLLLGLAAPRLPLGPGLFQSASALPASQAMGSPTGSASQTRGDVLPGLDPSREPTQFNLDVWTEREGLPQNFVNSLAQTQDGYLWLGGERGLVRFDGTRFSVFTPENTPGLSSAWIKTLYADADGTLWIGTGGGGLIQYRDGTFQGVGEPEGLAGRRVSAIARDTHGDLWIGTEGAGLFRKDGEGTFHHWDTSSGLSHDFITDLSADPNGAIWIGTPTGLNRMRGDQLRSWDQESGLPDPRVQSVLAEDDGSVWVGTAGGGLFRRDGEVFRPFDASGELAGTFVFSLFRDRQGALWVGTNGSGLFRIWDGEVARLTDDTGFPSNLVWEVLEDREGNLWVGAAAAGLIRLQDGLFETFGDPEGLSMEVALPVLEDEEGGIWVGTPGRGVNRIRDGVVTPLPSIAGLSEQIILSLAQDVDGAIWVGTVSGGVTRLTEDAVETFGPADGLSPNQITVTFVDSQGTFWLGSPGRGLEAWRPETGVTRSFGLDQGLPDTFVGTVAEDGDGRLWVGTRNGLARIDGDDVAAFGTTDGLPHATVHSLYEDESGAMWVATMGGLAHIREDRITPLGPEAGLPGTELMAVIEDELGYLWLTSNQGVTRVSRAQLEAFMDGSGDPAQPHQFGRADGLRSAEANGGIHPAILRASDGSIWFPTMAGAVRVDPADLERPTLPLRPIVEAVVLPDRSVPGHTAVNLPAGHRTLEFQFSAPTFIGADQVGFRYRLDGFDEDWVIPTERRAAYYTNLPPGRYTFRVQARGRDGNWGETEATVSVTLAPHFWERRSVQLSGALLLLLMGGIGYRYRIRALEEREGRLLKVVRQREQTEAALRRSEERLRLALDAGQMGTWEWNLDTGQVHWSQGVEEFFGPSPGSMNRLQEHLDQWIEPGDLARFRRAIRAVMDQREEEIQMDFAVSGPDGERRQVEIRGRWVDEENGHSRRIMGVAADVTALIETQRALRSREEELRQAQKMEAVGQLAGGVAHDFNNLLSVIGGNARLALHTLEADHPAKEDLLEIRKAGDRAATLTQQLLAFSRKQILQPRLLYLNEIIRNVDRMLSSLLRDNVKLKFELEPELGPVRVDEGGVEQILVNLILNAQDAMPEGGSVTIGTRNEAPLPQNSETRDDQDTPDAVRYRPHAVLFVSDTGQGMDEETRRRIFEPFFTTKEVGKGTGLGLASVYGIVKQSGGSVEAESQVGQGTTLRIRFPQIQETLEVGEGELSGDPFTEDWDPTKVDLTAPGGTERILLVEDNDPVRQVLRRILESYGYQVLEAPGGEEALELYHSLDNPVDLLLTDVVMPGMGGPELASVIREFNPHIPVLLISGHSEELVTTMAGRNPGVRFLPKPFTPGHLARQLRLTLETSSAERPG